MANIQKLTYPYFTDGTTQLNAANLNPIIAKLNEVIDQVNSGVSPTPTQTVATPTISISGTTATISCSTSGATIYYTTNGNTPTTSSTLYSSPITLSGACTIKAIAVKSGMNNSSVASTAYSPSASIQPPTIYIRDIAIIMDGESGSTIRYTTDGSTPTASSALYEGAFTLEGDSAITIKAKAFKNSESSNVATTTFTPRQDASVIVVVEGTKFTLLTSGTGKVQYDINESGTFTNYESPVTIAKTDKIRVRKWLSASSSYMYGCVQCSTNDTILVSQVFSKEFEHARIVRSTSTESMLNVAGTSQAVRVYAYDITQGRKYRIATSLSTSSYAYWGYSNSLPTSIAESDNLELTGKLGTDTTPNSWQTFDITAENFSYLFLCHQGTAYAQVFTEIIK